MQQLVERARVDALHRRGARDDVAFGEIHRDLQRRLRGALAGAGLQHIQPVLLHREFDVLHIAVMGFERLAHLEQFREHVRHHFFHRRQVRAVGPFAGNGQMLRRANPGDNVLTLRVDQEFAIELVGAGRRIAGEGDARGAAIAHIAEDHRLHVYRSTPVGGNVMEAAIGDGALVHPGTEHRANGAP